MRDVGEVQLEQVRQDATGGNALLVGARHLMDHLDPDPAAQAAADVELLLSGASGLQRIVEVAKAVDGDDPGSARPEAGVPDDDPDRVDANERKDADGA